MSKIPKCPHNYKGLWCPTCTTLPQSWEEEMDVVFEHLESDPNGVDWERQKADFKSFIHSLLLAKRQEYIDRVSKVRKECPTCDNDPQEQDPCNKEYNQALDDILFILKEEK